MLDAVEGTNAELMLTTSKVSAHEFIERQKPKPLGYCPFLAFGPLGPRGRPPEPPKPAEINSGESNLSHPTTTLAIRRAKTTTTAWPG